VNASGVVQWTANGVVVCDHDYLQGYPVLCPDGTGGAIIVWQDQRDQVNGGGAPPRGAGATASVTTEPDVYMQRIDGTGAAIWATNGIVVTDAPFDQFAGNIISDGAGGAVIAWIDDSDNDLNEDVILQRYDASGSEMWTPGGVIHATGVGRRQVFALVTSGDGNTIPVWNTFIETAVAPRDPAAMMAQVNTIYVQRVDNATGDCTCGTASSVRSTHTSRPLMLTDAAPNPSSGRAELRLFLESPAEVAVHVYDVRGRRVASQHIGRSGEGWHTLRFDGHGLASGVYFYNVTAGARTTTRKIVIQR